MLNGVIRLSLIEMAWSQDVKATREGAAQGPGEWAGLQPVSAQSPGSRSACCRSARRMGVGQIRADEVFQLTENEVTQSL